MLQTNRFLNIPAVFEVVRPDHLVRGAPSRARNPTLGAPFIAPLGHAQYACTVHAYCTCILYMHIVHVLYMHTVHAYCTCILYMYCTCILCMYSTCILYMHTVHAYCACTVCIYCMHVLYARTVCMYSMHVQYACTVHDVCAVHVTLSSAQVAHKSAKHANTRQEVTECMHVELRDVGPWRAWW